VALSAGGKWIPRVKTEVKSLRVLVTKSVPIHFLLKKILEEVF